VNAQLEAGGQLLGEERRVGAERYQVDGESLVSSLADGGDLAGDQRRRFSDHAEDTVAAGGKDSRDKLGASNAAHPGRDDRVVAAKHIAHGRPERRSPRHRLASNTVTPLDSGATAEVAEMHSRRNSHAAAGDSGDAQIAGAPPRRTVKAVSDRHNQEFPGESDVRIFS